MEDQADRQDLGQPRIATLRVGGAPDDDPSDGEQDNRYEEGGDRLERLAA